MVGLLRPQRAVIVERGDAFFRPNIVRAARFRGARHEIHDRCLGRPFVPGGQRIAGSDPGALWQWHPLPFIILRAQRSMDS